MSDPAILYLDADDEITSAATRLRSIEAERVVLVLPYGSRLATSRINFRLLAREATSRGKRLEIVAADASARALAGAAGLTVHASVAAIDLVAPEGAALEGAGPAEHPVAAVVPGPADEGETRVLAVPRSAEPLPIVGRPRRSIQPRVVLAIALAAVLLVGGGGLAAFLYLPSATIVLTPASEAIGPFPVTVEARTDVTSPDPTGLVIPAREFRFHLEANQGFTATGVKVTETKAIGNVTFRNCDPGSDGGVTIPAGSRVSTKNGIDFRTVASLTIKRAPLFQCRTGSVAIEAVKGGPDGNVAAETINQIPPGYDSFTLSVSNPKPTSGGAREESPQISQLDISTAMAVLDEALDEAFDAEIAAAKLDNPTLTLLNATKHLGTSTPTVDPDQLIGKQAETFELGLTATATIVGVDSAPVQQLAAQQLAGRVQSGWQLVDGSTTIDVGSPVVSGDVITFVATVTGRQARVVDHDALLDQIKGMDAPAARALLDDYGEVELSLWPGWVTTMPGDTSRISLTIDTTGGASSPGPSDGSSGGPSAAPAAS